MIISSGYAHRLIRQGKARKVGLVSSWGWMYLVIDRLDRQRTDHVRLYRV